MLINWSNLRLWVQFIQRCHWYLLSNPDWYSTTINPSFIQHTSSEYSPFLAFAQLRTLVLKWQRSHFWLRALCSKTVHFQMSSAPWRRSKPTAPISSLEWQHCRTKTQLFTSSDCWHASVCREYIYISVSPHRTHRLDRAPPTVYTSPRATKNMGRSAAGTFTRRVMGNHFLTSYNRLCIKTPYGELMHDRNGE